MRCSSEHGGSKSIALQQCTWRCVQDVCVQCSSERTWRRQGSQTSPQRTSTCSAMTNLRSTSLAYWQCDTQLHHGGIGLRNRRGKEVCGVLSQEPLCCLTSVGAHTSLSLPFEVVGSAIAVHYAEPVHWHGLERVQVCACMTGCREIHAASVRTKWHLLVARWLLFVPCL